MPSLKVILGVDKAQNLLRLVQLNGGILRSLYKILVNDTLKAGKLVGQDKYGNKYYENPYYYVPTNRWVEYNEKVFLSYNASQIPPEWHRWLQHIGEYPPTVERPVQHKWMIAHQENQTGTRFAYMPYSTTKQKIQPWVPNTSQNARLPPPAHQS